MKFKKGDVVVCKTATLDLFNSSKIMAEVTGTYPDYCYVRIFEKYHLYKQNCENLYSAKYPELELYIDNKPLLETILEEQC